MALTTEEKIRESIAELRTSKDVRAWFKACVGRRGEYYDRRAKVDREVILTNEDMNWFKKYLIRSVENGEISFYGYPGGVVAWLRDQVCVNPLDTSMVFDFDMVMPGISFIRDYEPALRRKKTFERSVRAFNQKLPLLRAMARAVTGNPHIKIQMTASGSYTDGVTLFIQPPMIEGKIPRHRKELCGERDENLQLECKGCQYSEELMIRAYHEMSHVAFNSFDCKPQMEQMTGVDKKPINLIWNAFEDARVNDALCRVRAGVQIMHEASMWRIFTNGIVAPDGQKLMWADNDESLQMVVGMMLKSWGYDYLEYLSEDCQFDLANAELSEYCNKVLTVDGYDTFDSLDSAKASLPILRQMGYFPINESEDANTEGDGSEQDQLDPGQAGDGSGTGETGEDASADRSDGATGEQSDREGNGQGSRGKYTDEELQKMFDEFLGHYEQEFNDEEKKLIEKIISVVENMDEVTTGICGIKVQTPPKKRSGWKPDVSEGILQAQLLKMRAAFADNAARKYAGGLASGRVNSKQLAKVALGHEKVFRKRLQITKKDYFVLIAIDQSGSTSWNNKIGMIKSAAYAQAEICERLGIPFAVYAHTTTDPNGGRDYSNEYGPMYEGDMLIINEIKSPTEPWGSEQRNRLADISWADYNLDGHNLIMYRKMCQKVRAHRKIVMYYTDGALPERNGTEELRLIKEELVNYKRENLDLMMVGVGSDGPKQHGIHMVRIDHTDELGKVTKFLADEILDDIRR